MKFKLTFMGLALFLLGCNTPVANEAPKTQSLYSVDGKLATIYTTADSTDLRMAQTGKQTFAAAGQPLETEVAIFVNPNKTFQTFFGIGGAVTDASAEVFATLLRAHSGRCPHLMTISPKRDRTIPIQIVEPCPGVPAWHDP